MHPQIHRALYQRNRCPLRIRDYSLEPIPRIVLQINVEHIIQTHLTTFVRLPPR